MGYRSGCFSTRLHDWLAPQNGEHILDLCAARAVKQHILEVAPEAQVLAVDIDEQRLSRLRQFKTPWYEGDRETRRWPLPFPMVWRATVRSHFIRCALFSNGVIRRHPDIKWLRRDRDIPELAQLQSEILDAIWSHLKSGGTRSMPPVRCYRKRIACRLKPFATYR